jgi:hypothetical protein
MSKLAKNIHPGRRKQREGYSILSTKSVPKSRNIIERYLTGARQELVKNLGPTEDDLTASQIILIDRVISKLGIIRCIEERCRETGEVFRNNRGELVPSLGQNYLAYSNSIRHDLAALGINTKQGEKELSLDQYIALKDRENAAGGDTETSGDANGDKTGEEKGDK